MLLLIVEEILGLYTQTIVYVENSKEVQLAVTSADRFARVRAPPFRSQVFEAVFNLGQVPVYSVPGSRIRYNALKPCNTV